MKNIASPSGSRTRNQRKSKRVTSWPTITWLVHCTKD